MLQLSESRISVTLDLSLDEAADLASSLARATPSMLIPLTGLSGLPSTAARLAITSSFPNSSV
jgi:hypothetical protein